MMKQGHLLTGAALAVPVGVAGHPLFATGIMLGATAPDWLEMPYRVGYGTWKRVIPHRTLTHWPMPYLLALIGLWLFGQDISATARMVAMGFAAGALLHLLMDFGTPMGIPLMLPFSRRTTAGLYKTGGIGEMAVVLGTWGLSAAILAMGASK